MAGFSQPQLGSTSSVLAGPTRVPMSWLQGGRQALRSKHVAQTFSRMNLQIDCSSELKPSSLEDLFFLPTQQQLIRAVPCFS